jgi:hypothetical protein
MVEKRVSHGPAVNACLWPTGARLRIRRHRHPARPRIGPPLRTGGRHRGEFADTADAVVGSRTDPRVTAVIRSLSPSPNTLGVDPDPDKTDQLAASRTPTTVRQSSTSPAILILADSAEDGSRAQRVGPTQDSSDDHPNTAM